MKELTEGAFAKVNLTLDVLDKREDGYHNLRSIMQTVSLHDAQGQIQSDFPGKDRINQ